MSCTKTGKSCGTTTDCNCLGQYCSTSGVCTSNTCTGDNDCTANFGPGSGCVNGQCTQVCSSTSPCPASMTCTNSVCTSMSCNGSRCPFGMRCTKLSDGTKVCLSNPGLKQPLFLIMIAFIALIFSVIFAWVFFAKIKPNLKSSSSNP
jgi:hypothetical protein